MLKGGLRLLLHAPAPETIGRLGQAEGKVRAATGAHLGALQCTHPRRDTRVQMVKSVCGKPDETCKITEPDSACACRGAPDTFRRLGQAEGKMRAAMGGNVGALQCTHPRSDTCVQMLGEDLWPS